MKLSSIFKILLKAIFFPLISLRFINKFNICDKMLFIPDGYRFEAGLSFYMAILEVIEIFLEYFITIHNANIKCVFYKDVMNEDSDIKPIIQMSDDTMQVTSVWCHVVLDGDYKKLSGVKIILDIPSWFSAQIEDNNKFKQDKQQIILDVSTLLPGRDNSKKIHTETRIKLFFIRVDASEMSIDIEPTIERKFGLGFETNGFTIRSIGGGNR